MIYVALLGGVIIGAAAMATYSLAHGSQVQKLGAEIMGEVAKLKDLLKK